MDCPSLIPKIKYGDFSKRLHSSVVKDRIPIGGSIDLTNHCNLDCVHCYIREAGSADALDTAQLCRVLDEIAAAGCLWLLLTGGEPLIRKDFRDIYKHAHGNGMLINLFTNATLMTEEMADFLAERPPFAAEVSLYGMSEETYSAVTGVSGAFDRCMDGIRMLNDRGIPLRLKSMILTLNSGELDEMMEFASSMDAEFRYDTNIHGRVDGGKDPCKYRLTPEQIVELDLRDRRRISALREFVDYATSTGIDKDRVFHCGAGLNSFHIGADGKLYMCMMYRNEGYDLMKGSFSDGWNGLIQDLRFHKATSENKCASCEHYFLCGQCPGWGQVEEGDKMEASRFLCKLAHLRAEKFAGDPLWVADRKDKSTISGRKKAS